MNIRLTASIKAMLFAISAYACMPPSLLSGQTYSCVPVSDSNFVSLRDMVVANVTSTDAAAQARYHLPAVAASKVSMVTAVKTCRAAGAAFQARYPSDVVSGQNYPMMVLKVSNNRFVVVNPAFSPGDYTIVMTFDSKWVLLGEVAN